MPESLLGRSQRERSAAYDLVRRWVGSIELAVAVGIAYFLGGLLGIDLLMPPERVAVFWPAAGISSGALIALGPAARWSVAAGVMVATIVVNLLSKVDIWATCAFALGNTAEPLIIAGLIEHYFGARFTLDRLRPVLGLLAAAVTGPIVAGIGWTVVYRLFHPSTVPILTTWQHWFTSDITGIVTVAPLVIGLVAAVRQPPPRKELMKGFPPLVALAVVTGIIISLPQAPWDTVMPVAWLFPILLGLAALCRPIFAAAGAFMVSLAIVSTTILGIGHFGNADLPVGEHILQAQAVILVVTIFALAIAALFVERRETEARLSRSNMMLERERDNKLMNAQAITASIAHEVRQPVGAIITSAHAARRLLKKASPGHDEARATLNDILNDIISDGYRANEVFDGIRALFEKIHRGRQPIDVNEMILGVLNSLRRELKDHGVTTHLELTSELPLIDGHRNQLERVIFNLVHNALEAMEETTDRTRVLRIRTELRDSNAIVVALEDSGPGIDPKQLDNIFGAFFTTKSHGMGPGLAICRMIIEQHGGQLTASSDGKNGTLFQLVLPIQRAEKATA